MQNKVVSFLTKTQNTILSAALIMAFATAFNSIFGFIKGRVLTSYFGISSDLAVYFIADKIPSLIYSVLIVGAVSTLFIPVFSALLKKNEKEAYEAASAIINATLAVFGVLAFFLFITAPLVIQAISLGQLDQTQIELGSKIIRILLAAQLLLVIGSLITSVLQSFKYFIIPALAPVFYNIGMLLGIVLFAERFGIFAPAIGSLIGSALHIVIQIPLLKKIRFRYFFKSTFNNKGLTEITKLVPPRIASVLIGNLIDTVNNSLAILISTQSVIFLKYASQLQTLPVNLFGLSMATASLPTLSAESSNEDHHQFKKTFLTSFMQMMFLIMPLSVILFVLRIPVVRIVYGVSKFPWEATIQTAYTLAFFSISIFAQSSNYMLTRAFYALKDTTTPVIVGLVTLFINIPLSYIFIQHLQLGVWALALSYSITSIIDTCVYFYLLHKKIGGFDYKTLSWSFLKIAYSALMMGLMLYIPIKLLDKVIFDTTRTINLIILTGIAGTSGMSVYLLLTKLLNVHEINLFYKLIRKLNLRKTETQAPISEQQTIQ